MTANRPSEDSLPSVDSENAEERIAARRLRIQKRIEQSKRAAQGSGDGEFLEKEIKEELTKSRKQMEASRVRLTKLAQDGTELVTNIRVATDAREAIKRNEEEETSRQRKDRLEAEAKLGQEKFDEITKKWEMSLQKEIPQDLHQMLKQQKDACDAMIEDKNKLINDFTTDLKLRDDQYVKNLKKQAENIDLLIERMEEQCKNITKAYRDELTQIEESFIAQRNELLTQHRQKWTDGMSNRAQREVKYMETRQAKVDEYEALLQQQRVQDADEYNDVKRKLEDDVQILEQQLQQMRATYQLNTEKLEYNFQVLKKRDEENTITKSQQKRKITRLQDLLNNLRIKLNKQEKQFRDENCVLAEDYKRVTELFHDLQRKSRHFVATDAAQFEDIWRMNEEEAKTLAQRILDIDKIIHEQQLGLQWNPASDLNFLNSVGPLAAPITGDSVVHVSALEIANRLLTNQPGNAETSEAGETLSEQGVSVTTPDVVEFTEPEAPLDPLNLEISPSTMKSVLELLADESGFLVESKLTKLLAPLEQDEQNLMKLDAIFAALGVESSEDLNSLSRFVVNFIEVHGSTASGGRRKSDGGESNAASPHGSDSLADSEPTMRSATKTDADADAAKTGSLATPQPIRSASQLESGDKKSRDETSEHLSLTEETPAAPQYAANLIHPNDLYRALKAFVTEHHKNSRALATKLAPFRLDQLEQRDASHDAAYWAKYHGILPPQRRRLWEALVAGFEKYHNELNLRATLLSETNALRQQNGELRMLLQQYISSKVNADLQVPPMKTVPVDNTMQ